MPGQDRRGISPAEPGSACGIDLAVARQARRGADCDRRRHLRNERIDPYPLPTTECGGGGAGCSSHMVMIAPNSRKHHQRCSLKGGYDSFREANL
jgi:hypothetical protein